MKTNRFSLLTAIFAVLMSVSSAKAQLMEAGVQFVMNAYIKNKEAREKMKEIQPTYDAWIKSLEDYVSKTGKVGDCDAIGFKYLPNNSRETPNFSYQCGIKEDGNIAFLNAKNKIKIDNCDKGSEFTAEFDIRKNYLDVFSFPINDACVFFQASCRTLISGFCPSDMMFVGEGTFTMGFGLNEDHLVTVNSFCIGKYEVTQKEWQEVMGNNPSKFQNCGSNCPVEQVSWNDTQEFIRRLNAKTSMNYRLPTEAEWEYAASGGCRSKNYKYSGSNNLDNVAWYYKNSNKKPHAVGTKQPNTLGIYDMSGNVWEWVNDWRGFYKKSEVNNPKGPSSGSDKIARGGAWTSDEKSCRIANRAGDPPNTRKDISGFRLVHSPVDAPSGTLKFLKGKGRGEQPSGQKKGFNSGYYAE